jgi:NAD(P)-dependent dehydrogenase (short-subunit alcohol dehydrogenase family)
LRPRRTVNYQAAAPRRRAATSTPEPEKERLPDTLKDQVIVVTGGAGLLGRAFVRGIVEHGGTAIVADLDVERAAEVAGPLAASASGRAAPARLDITDAASVTAMIAEVRGRYGRIDAVVNNAYPRNQAYGRPLESVRYADFCDNVSQHLGGYFLVAQQFALTFRTQGGGSIVNMSSIYGSMTPRFDVYAGTSMTMPVEYAAIKAGVIHLTRYFAQYYKREGIRVNSLSPGGIRDAQPEPFQLAYDAHAGSRGLLQPTDLVGALVFLLSDASRFVTGQNLIVDDGFSL